MSLINTNGMGGVGGGVETKCERHGRKERERERERGRGRTMLR